MKKMNLTAKRLYGRIQSKNARVAIVGLGYVGLPLAVAFLKQGFRVLGIDLDKRRIESLKKGKSYIEDIPSADFAEAVRKKQFEPVHTFEPLKRADVAVVCVPTPLNRAKDPDLSFVSGATESIRKYLKRGQLIILESTTYPGTTEEFVQPALERSGLKVGKDFFLCFSPERIDPGNKEFPLTKIPKVVGGVEPASTRLASALYGHVSNQVIPVSSARTAEMAKLLENTFRIVNIGLVNELAQAAEALQVDIWEAIQAASSKPFGFMPFYPGPGIGGHCIGVDPLYLSWKARMQGVDIHFIDLARRINASMPKYVVERAVYALNARAHKAANGSKILILGISYKPDVKDTRESPAFEILHELKKLGADVNYSDPYVPQLQTNGLRLKSQALNARNLREHDLVILTTHHSRVPYPFVAQHARLIFDTRNVAWPKNASSKVVRL